jgi:hypothetical protein
MAVNTCFSKANRGHRGGFGSTESKQRLYNFVTTRCVITS